MRCLFGTLKATTNFFTPRRYLARQAIDNTCGKQRPNFEFFESNVMEVAVVPMTGFSETKIETNGNVCFEWGNQNNLPNHDHFLRLFAGIVSICCCIMERGQVGLLGKVCWYAYYLPRHQINSNYMRSPPQRKFNQVIQDAELQWGSLAFYWYF